MAYTLRKKKYYVKQALLGLTPISEICRNRKVPRRTLYRWIANYKQYKDSGLENKNPGIKETSINRNCELIICKFWYEHKYGSHKTWLELRDKGIGVSQRQIQKIFNKYGFKMNRRKRPSQIKFVKYEWPKPNMLWHTDWTTCPFTGKQMIAFIDDHSRFIVHAEYFENATTENTLLAFSNAIQKYGKPEAILTDNGTQFTPARSESGPFTKWCEERGIKHILGRVHHPQTNGKIERWFGTYKIEYDERFSCLDEFVKFYNEIRIHQGINYTTPLDRYKSAINAV
ncbi:MAG: DDE-type integrase/transposase/recombinase [Nanoarchaeota archaeon]|nr:DDE-type integrase/transposase/recombinase [Nanoarchaeota archaeon]